MQRKQNPSRYHRFLCLTVALVFGAVTGCQTPPPAEPVVMEPVYNVVDAPVTTRSWRYTTDEMAEAVVRAGEPLGWRFQRIADRRMLGALDKGEEEAVVNIKFSWRALNINHRDSRNLGYDGTIIDSSYNRWIRELEQAILREFAQI